MAKRELTIVQLGRTRYGQAWEVQRSYFERRVAGFAADTLLLTEHEHVYTLGTSSDDQHLLASTDELRALGADVHHVDRGGDITYHGPGQIVGYPVIHLGDAGFDAHGYLRSLEEVIIRSLSRFGIRSTRDSGLTGVWVGSEKIAAIGIKVSHWVTMHGFALNVNTDLGYFGRIIPCGIFHKGVTSMEHILGHPIPMDDVTAELVRNFRDIFSYDLTEQPAPAECPR